MSQGVFLSWSGERSMRFARELKWWLPRVVHGTRAWMSDVDIAKGERWSTKIGQQLESHRVGIICVTPENMTSEWLLFEAGALSRTLDEARVCPVLLGMRANDLMGPLSQFQATVFEREEMHALARSLNARLGDDASDELVLNDAFRHFWDEFEDKVRAVTHQQVETDSVPLIIKTFAKHGLPSPNVGRIAHFGSGFESHSIYGTACSVADRRLNVFGRKNRKLFDKEHSEFFKTLKPRVDSGFDFRCLFLDPASPKHVIAMAHEDDAFLEQLTACIRQAAKVVRGAGLEPGKHIRLYNVPRTSAMVIVDNAVLYTPIHIGQHGRATALTKCGFSVVDSHAVLGHEIISEFDRIWEGARTLDDIGNLTLA